MRPAERQRSAPGRLAAPPGLDVGAPTVLVLQDGGAARVSVHGELDLRSAVTLIDGVRSALRSRPETLTLVLTDVTFIDVAGLRALIRCRHMAVGADAGFGIEAVSPAVSRLLGIVGMTRLFGLETHPPPS